MKEPKIVAIVLTYNGKHLIERMLNSLQKTEYENWQVIVVDNGSADGSSDLVRKKFPKVDLLRLEPNRGFAGGNNAATEYALKKYTPDYIVWLNDDMEIVDTKWLKTMVEAAERANAGITGCKLLLPDGRIQYAGGFIHPLRITYHRGLLEPDNGQYDDEREVDYANGACFLIRKQVMEKIGLLDEGYSPIYFEEVDYCVRARKAGFKVVYTGKAKIIHHTSATVSKEQEDKRYYIWEKNRLRFVRKHFPLFWKPFAFVRILAGAIFSHNPIGRLQILKKAWGDSGN